MLIFRKRLRDKRPSPFETLGMEEGISYFTRSTAVPQ
jgi:hypothetical protein